MISFNNVRFFYKDKKGTGLEVPDLSIKDGECVLITGVSGSGKSTLTKCINGLIPEFFEGDFWGRVCIGDYNLEQLPVYEISKFVGSVFQDPSSQFFTENTISELAFACENYGVSPDEIKKRMETIISTLHIEPLVGKKLSEMSNGEKQKIAIASVLTMQPRVIVFDEPSSNLDYESILTLKEIIKTLKAQGMTVIIAEHRIYYLQEVFDRVLYVSGGKIEKEYTASEFKAMSGNALHTLGLRSLAVFENEGIEKKIKTLSTAVKMEHIEYAYKDSGKKILHGIDFQLYRGEVTALVGRNGIGKTTLARILSGVYKQDSGTVFIDGEAVPHKKRVSTVQFVMNDVDYQLFGDSVYHELVIGNENVEDLHIKIESVLHQLNLQEVRDAHPMSLSGGQKQRLVIAASYIRNCTLTIFDEPTSGLDYRNMLQVSALLKNLAGADKAVMIISHDYEFIVNTCTRVLLLGENGIECDICPGEKKEALRQIFTENLGGSSYREWVMGVEK